MLLFVRTLLFMKRNCLSWCLCLSETWIKGHYILVLAESQPTWIVSCFICLFQHPTPRGCYTRVDNFTNDRSPNVHYLFYKMVSKIWAVISKEILTAMRVMVVSIGSRGSHIPAMWAGMWDPLDPIETTMTRIYLSSQYFFYIYTEQYVFYTPK